MNAKYDLFAVVLASSCGIIFDYFAASIILQSHEELFLKEAVSLSVL